MTALCKLQESLQTHLLVNDAVIMDYITGATRERVVERLAVYGDGYFARLLEVLAVGYGTLQQFLGECAFSKMGEAYIKAYPSRYFSVDVFGQHLPEFLATTQPYAEQPYLAELADFIWRLNRAIDAPDGPVLTVDKIAAIPQESWPEMRLKFHPSVDLVAVHWNIVPIWQALNQNQEPPEAKQITADLNNSELSKGEVCNKAFAVLWRKQNQPYFYPLTEQEAWVLQSLQNNKTFGEVCDGLLQWLPEDQIASYAVSLLLRWFQEEMFSEVII